MSDEFARSLSLARHGHDRDSSRRSREGQLELLWNDPRTRIILLRNGKAVARPSADAASMSLEMFVVSHLENLPVTHDQALYLGRSLDGEANYLALVLPEGSTLDIDGECQWIDLRVWGHAMPDIDTGLFTQALALANWHASHEFSAATGEPTAATSAGWVRSTDNSLQHFPRTDVAVIVLVTDAHDRVLLGNNALWESNRFSLLAGYVDPGESLEAAVIREVFEESGMTVENPTYMGSQPWPFPASLMVGFTAQVTADHADDALRPDGEEILSLRWFSRDEIRGSLDDIVLPGRTSIARSLLEHWLGEPIDQDAVWIGQR
jgi:NAD+ diphosphatase